MTIPKSNWLFPFVILLLFSCRDHDINQKEQIKKISYTVYGGEMGKTFEVCISKDSIKLFNRNNAQDSTIKNNTFGAAAWAKLTNAFSLNTFKKIKNGKSNAPVDGIDRIFIIYTVTDTYRLVNPESDYLNYWRINGLTKYLMDFEFNSNR